MYLFLDDDEIIISRDEKDKNVIFGKLFIDNFPSVVRIFRYTRSLHYMFPVHEELFNGSKYIEGIQTNWKISHQPKNVENKIKKYIKLNNFSLYYRIRDSWFLGNEYYISNVEYNEMIKNNDYNSMIIILIINIYFSKRLGLSHKKYTCIKEKLKKLNIHNEKFISDLINNRKSDPNVLTDQNFFQNKFSLLMNI